MDARVRERIRMLIQQQRQAALAVLSAGEPLAAMVAYAEEDDCGAFLIHLSSLSAHKRALASAPRCSLLICEPDSGVDDVQTLARLSVQGDAVLIERTSAAYVSARDCYLRKLPQAQVAFTLPDFDLLRITPVRARFVGGFAQALAITDWAAIVTPSNP